MKSDYITLNYEEFKFVIPIGIEYILPYYEICLTDHYNLLLDDVKASDILLDVGANIGIFTVLASKKVNKVIAVEPDPYNYKYLKKNIELNNIKNVIISNKAVSNYKGVTFISSKGSQSKLAEKGIKINVTTIDELLNEHNIDIDALKMDIEGSEYEALDGKFLERCKRLMVEIHNDLYEEIYQRLEKHGFRIIEWKPSKIAIIKQSVKHFGHFCDAELKSGFPATKMIFRYIFRKDIPYMNDHGLRMIYAYKL